MNDKLIRTEKGTVLTSICFYALVLSVFGLIINNVFGVKAYEIFSYYLFVIGAMLLPGLAVMLTLRKGKLNEYLCSSMVFQSILIGYGINILEYLLFFVFRKKISPQLICIVVAIISVAVIVKALFVKRDNKSLDRKALNYNHIINIFFVVLLIVGIGGYACAHPNIFDANHDECWWLNNTVALKLGFEPQNLFMSDTLLQYHYFSNMQIAFSSMVTGINVVSLSIPFYVFIKACIMVASLDCIKYAWKFEKNTIYMFFFVLLLFTTGVENTSTVMFYSHMITVPFGFDVGFVFAIAFMCELKKQWEEEKFNIGIFILAVLYWFVSVGAKAPISVVMLMCPGLVCVWWLFHKDYKKCFVYGITILGVFLFVSIYFVGLISVCDGSNSAYYIEHHGLDYIRTVYGYGFELPLIISCCVKIFTMNPAICILVIISAFYLFKVWKQVEIKTIVIAGIYLVAYGWGFFLWQVCCADGISEMYYAMAGFIPGVFFVLTIYETCKGDKTISLGSELDNFIIYQAVAVVIVGVFLFSYRAWGKTGMLVEIKNNVAALEEIKKDADTSSMDALRWLRDNSKQDALVISDSAVMADNAVCYSYGIVSERQQYLEGTHMLRFADESTRNEIERRTDLIMDLYNNDGAALKKVKDEGVDYIVQTKNITPDFIPTEELEKVAESADVVVYRIK